MRKISIKYRVHQDNRSFVSCLSSKLPWQWVWILQKLHFMWQKPDDRLIICWIKFRFEKKTVTFRENFISSFHNNEKHLTDSWHWIIDWFEMWMFLCSVVIIVVVVIKIYKVWFMCTYLGFDIILNVMNALMHRKCMSVFFLFVFFSYLYALRW